MYIDVNNIKLYYEEYGAGLPIILLHGNSEDHLIFDKLVDRLKNEFKVYVIDSRCHGKSEQTSEISYDLMAEDIYEFIKTLKIEKTILYGFSDGGIVGLKIAIKYPNILSKLIISGANISLDGIKSFYIAITKLYYFFTRDKIIKMMLKDTYITLEELHSINKVVHVIAGENDVIKKKHTKLIADNIKNSTLEIIQKENHGSYIIHSDKIYDIIRKYIK